MNVRLDEAFQITRDIFTGNTHYNYNYENTIRLLTFSISIIVFILHFNASLVFLTIKKKSYITNLHV